MLAKQQKLFAGLELGKGKREHYTPIWKKFYSVYQFDFTLYHRLRNDIKYKPPFNLLSIYLNSTKFMFYIVYFCMYNTLTIFEVKRIRKLCFVLDENNKKKHKGDEKHIYRYETLYKIYAKLYEYAELNPFLAKKEIIKRLKTQTKLSDEETTIMCRIKELCNNGYAIYLDEYIDDKGKLIIDNQLEIKGTEMLSIKERIKAHISLLRRLKRGERL